MQIESGLPSLPGDYVGYSPYSTYEGRPLSLLLEWTGTGWKYHGSKGDCRLEICGWIGPLPSNVQMDYDL